MSAPQTDLEERPVIYNRASEGSEDVKEIKREDIHNELRGLGGPHPEDQKFDPQAVRRLTLKMDAVLVPLTFAIYSFCFIDRSSIGNAGIAGFKTNLGLVGDEYNLGVSIFFIAYVAFQIPSNLAMKFIGAKIWLTFLILSFGGITVGTAWIKDKGDFYAVRFLLGMVEGGVLSGMALLLGSFYTREQMTLRIGVYFLCASSSGAFGGILAYGLIQIGPHGNLYSWSYIFLVEGCISIALGILTFFALPSSIESAWFLNADDKRLARARMQQSNRLHENVATEKTQWHLIFRAIRNPFNLLCGLCYFGESFIVQSLAIFTPTILTGLGYTVEGAQLASVWPNLMGFFTNLAVLFLSNRINRKGVILMGCFCFDMIGFGMLLSTNHHVQYAGLFIVNITSSAPGPLLVGWAGGNNAPLTARAVAIAMPTTIGHFGAIASAWSFQAQDAPRYLLGNGLNFGMAGWSFFVALAALLYLRWENHQRAAGKRDHRITGDPVKDGELGSHHPDYRFIY